MPIKEARAAGLVRHVREDEDGCGPYWELTNPDLLGNFEWVDLRHIQRIDIANAAGYLRYRTAEGIGAGSTVDELRRAYGSRLSRLPDDPGDGPSPTYDVTTESGSIIFHTAIKKKRHTGARTEVSYLSVVPPAPAQELKDLAEFQDSDPC